MIYEENERQGQRKARTQPLFELALDDTHAPDSVMQALDAINDRYDMGTV